MAKWQNGKIPSTMKWSNHHKSWIIVCAFAIYLSMTIAANFQSLIKSASSSDRFIRFVINCNSLNIKCRSLWLHAVLCSSTVVGRPKLLQIRKRFWNYYFVVVDVFLMFCFGSLVFTILTKDYLVVRFITMNNEYNANIIYCIHILTLIR